MTLRLTRLGAAQYPCLIIAKSTNVELSHAPQSGRGELGCGNADGHPGARPGDEARRITRCPSRLVGSEGTNSSPGAPGLTRRVLHGGAHRATYGTAVAAAPS